MAWGAVGWTSVEVAARAAAARGSNRGWALAANWALEAEIVVGSVALWYVWNWHQALGGCGRRHGACMKSNEMGKMGRWLGSPCRYRRGNVQH